MNLEIFYYIFLLFLSVIFLYKEFTQSIFFKIYLLSGIFLSITLRSKDPSMDFHAYNDFLNSDLSSIFKNSKSIIYYAKECLFWFPFWGIYQIYRFEILVYLTIDVITLLFIYNTFKNFKVPQHTYIAFLYAFPTILGMQGIYRQWIATSILVYTISIVRNVGKVKYFYLICSILIHNSMILFSGLIFINSKNQYTRFLGYFLTLSLPLFIFIGTNIKANEIQSGYDFRLLYILVGFLFTTFLIVENSLKISNNQIYKTLWYYNFCLTISLLLITNQVPFERVYIIIISILYPLFSLELSNRIKSSKLILLIFSFSFFFIIFFSGANYVFFR